MKVLGFWRLVMGSHEFDTSYSDSPSHDESHIRSHEKS